MRTLAFSMIWLAWLRFRFAVLSDAPMLPLLIRASFWVAALLAFVMAVLPQPPALPAPDKMQHMIAFFALAVLGTAAYSRISPVLLAALLCAFGGLIELVQIAPALNRDGDLLDWVADIVAAASGLLLVHAWRQVRAARQRPISGN